MRKKKAVKRSAATIALLFCLVITVAAIGVGAGFLIYKNVIAGHDAGKDRAKSTGSGVSAVYPAGDGSGSAVSGDHTADSATMASLEARMASVTDKVSSSASFPGGAKGTKGTWMLGNPDSNHVLMQATLVDSDDKTIATSVVIQPGQHIESLSLSRDVSAGSHTVTATISYFDPDTEALIGKAAYKIKLTVA